MTETGKKKTHSLNREITIIFVAIMALTVGACVIVNSLFLEKIYVKEKRDEIHSVYTKIENYGDDVDSHTEELETL